MKVSVIGGGAWGTTLAQVLLDNNHEVIVYDINADHIKSINKRKHPFFKTKLPENIKATANLKEALDFADIILLSVPTKAIRTVLKEINTTINNKKLFVNVSKGIEPETTYLVSQICTEEIDQDKLEGFVCLTGPSHAEEVILRKLTLLTAASNNMNHAKKVQELFSNDSYLRVYTTKDLIGAEVGGAVKNAIAVVSGISTGLDLGENARAAIISRGILEVIRVVEVMGGKKETAFGLTGIGDLIVTASSNNSRNFQAGLQIGQGVDIKDVSAKQNQTIEGIRTIEALHDLSVKNNIELPLINSAYLIINKKLNLKDAVPNLLSRDLKSEDFH